ncbi:hypothetical protein BCON_0011g00550 [Botryotinia convoluta]|uniref:Uncharacterized protein n=1 Tax=Botryotinia convoluta TaxID=54673 RepID=A0A4Z1J3R8_9HELO|nr:hypothetical protein BCON_0011g00550 [Botryotinia convoluta]
MSSVISKTFGKDDKKTRTENVGRSFDGGDLREKERGGSESGLWVFEEEKEEVVDYKVVRTHSGATRHG